jgi:hypothetical protein
MLYTFMSTNRRKYVLRLFVNMLLAFTKTVPAVLSLIAGSINNKYFCGLTGGSMCHFLRTGN